MKPFRRKRNKPQHYWKRSIELRGMEDRECRVYDYINNKSYGTVRGREARLPEFDGHLLLEIRPE